MLDLNDFRYFVEVVERGGFSAASRGLQRPTSTISYRIQQLEHELGVTLLARTSRSVVMTQAGEEFYVHARSMIARANEAEFAMRDRSKAAVGTVRYTVAMDVAQFAMADMLASFMTQYPEIKLVQHVSNDMVDIVVNRYDVAIRAHSKPLPDSRLVQRALVLDAPWYLFASPEYVRQRGPFASPRDLGKSEMLLTMEVYSPTLELIEEGDRSSVLTVNVRPRMHSACPLTLKRVAEGGLGIVALPAYVCRDEVRVGRLERVLPGWIAAESKISAIMSHRRGMTAATRAFIEHIAVAFRSSVDMSVDMRSSLPDTRIRPWRILPVPGEQRNASGVDDAGI